jgi:hypothetical protein
MGTPLKIPSSLNVNFAWVVGFGFFASIFLITGLVIGYFSILSPMWRSHVAKNWLETPCQIIRSELENDQDSKGHIYHRLAIAYQYQVAGRKYQSTQYDFTGTHSGSNDWMTAAVRANPAGKKTVCFVDPQDPTSAVLIPDFYHEVGRWFVPGVPGLFGVLLLMGVACIADRKRKFGSSNFELKNAPVPIGGVLDGTVTMERVILPKGGYAVKLVCIHCVTTHGWSARGIRTTYTRETALWEDAWHAQPRTGGSVPINFVLPKSGVETSSVSADDRIFWRLEVMAKVPGVGYAAKFEIPVVGGVARH